MLQGADPRATKILERRIVVLIIETQRSEAWRPRAVLGNLINVVFDYPSRLFISVSKISISEDSKCKVLVILELIIMCLDHGI